MRSALFVLLLAPLLAWALPSDSAPRGTFAGSFLIFPEEVRDAAKDHRRVIVFLEQEGCPACLKMARTTLVDPEVTRRLRRGFVLIAVDIFGARDTVWTDGVSRPEKALAGELRVRATPTVILLDEHGATLRQFVGYRDPAAFRAILEAAAPR